MKALCLIAVLAMAAVPAVAQIDQVPYVLTLAWTGSSSNDVVGVEIYSGGESRVYTNKVRLGVVTNATVAGWNHANYYAVVAIGTNEVESPFSNEAVWRPPNQQTNRMVTISVQTNSTLAGKFVDDARFRSVTLTNPIGLSVFFKTSISQTNF